MDRKTESMMIQAARAAAMCEKHRVAEVGVFFFGMCGKVIMLYMN